MRNHQLHAGLLWLQGSDPERTQTPTGTDGTNHYPSGCQARIINECREIIESMVHDHICVAGRNWTYQSLNAGGGVNAVGQVPVLLAVAGQTTPKQRSKRRCQRDTNLSRSRFLIADVGLVIEKGKIYH